MRITTLDLLTTLTGSDGSGERATDLLRADHHRIRELADEYRAAMHEQSDMRRAIAEEICMQLELHAVVEEEIFYPAVLRQSESLVSESIEAHRSLERDIAQLERMTLEDARYDHIAMRIIEAVSHHIDKEERSLFPIVEQRLPHLLPELNKQMVRRKEELAGSADDLEGRS